MKDQENQRLGPELESAFTALGAYDHGGKRSALLPIDRAVVQSLDDAPLRGRLERALVGIVSGNAPDPARQYACEKLSLVGSHVCIRSVAGLLSNPKVATEARTVLETIPDDAAGKALLAALPKLRGPERAGVIRSLAVRRYTPAIKALEIEAAANDPEIRRAAADALELLRSAARAPVP